MALTIADASFRPVAAQGTPQWVRQRIGHLTASRMNDAMDYTKAGKPSAARIQYLHEVVAERLADVATEHYVTKDMQHGIDSEPLAADAYAQVFGCKLATCEFTVHPKVEFFGASPDRRIVGTNGLIEIKCPRTPKFVAWKLAGVVPEEHKAQMIAQMLCTGAEFVDFVGFDPRLPEKHRLFVRRFVPTQEERDNVLGHAIQFLKEADAMFNAVVEVPL
jgi:predicted phage-related endonuclease